MILLCRAALSGFIDENMGLWSISEDIVQMLPSHVVEAEEGVWWEKFGRGHRFYVSRSNFDSNGFESKTKTFRTRRLQKGLRCNPGFLDISQVVFRPKNLVTVVWNIQTTRKRKQPVTKVMNPENGMGLEWM